MTAYDPVENPKHYAAGPIECIDWIRAELSPEEFRGYLKGNIYKYLWRYQDKGKPVQDLKKAQWYLDRFTKEVARGQVEEEPHLAEKLVTAMEDHLASEKDILEGGSHV